MSRLKEFFVKSKDAITSKEVIERLDELERALQIQYVDKPQSESDKAKGEAAAAVIQSLETVSAAVVQLGSLLILKNKNDAGEAVIFTRTLSQRELAVLSENPNLLASPATVLDELAAKKGEQ